MADRTLNMPPPTPEYRQIGWHCIYHEQAGRSCHNPLDCDLVPVWAMTVAAAKSRMNKDEGWSEFHKANLRFWGPS